MIWLRRVRIAAITTTERAFLPCALIQVECIRWCLKCSFLLLPHLFRGVTPDRHAGEAPIRAIQRWLAHSGYPFWEKEPKNPTGPLRHMCHMATCSLYHINYLKGNIFICMYQYPTPNNPYVVKLVIN